MAEQDELVNEDWEVETVAAINSFRSLDLYLTYAQKNILDTIIKTGKGVPLEYIVVSGTPSEELDANGRKEINAGSSFIDSRLEDKRVTQACFGGFAYNSKDYTKPTTGTATVKSTFTMTNGSTWGLGEIISLTVR